MPRERLQRLCEELQRELDDGNELDAETERDLREHLMAIHQALEQEPGEHETTLGTAFESLAERADARYFPGSRLIGQIAEKLNEMGI
ncbi:MAG: hypothetical protein ACOCXJ_06335 [Planctomycetota bacterium]